MVWSGSSSSTVVASAVVVSGEIATSIVCDWGGGGMAPFSDMIATSSEMVGDATW